MEMSLYALCLSQLRNIYISAHKQLISQGASSKLEYVLEHWLIYVNMIKSLSAAKNGSLTLVHLT